QGQLAVLSAAVRTSLPQEAVIIGTMGKIKIYPSWWRGTALTLSIVGKEDLVIELPFTGNGYTHQAEEVMHCLRAGKTESATMPLAESLSIMKTMDQIRAQWGLKYPTE
ncbi:MAG: gfo/Idh/MocA family oxidoreductase, partial [Anaerolineae bacterium]|nr:gfo/Idh/MocA family oxidoreductase [Anaerolineae bacterium]